MNADLTLEVQLPNKTRMVGSPVGQLMLRGDNLILEQPGPEKETAPVEGQPRQYHLPLSRLKDIQLERTLLALKLVCIARSRDFIESIPGSDGIILELGIKKAQASKAERFFKLLKLRHSEIVLRGLSEEPTEY